MLKLSLLLLLAVFNIMEFKAGETTLNAQNTNEMASYTMSVKDRSKNQLIQEVDKYIKSMAPDSKLSSSLLVEKCLYYDVDIVFVLAQAVIESHLGTKGVANTTNSVWNVGTYDNGKPIYKYKHPDDSIDPYLKLLRTKYLVSVNSKGDTLKKDVIKLIQDKGFKNINGHRYASAVTYESSLRTMMLKIDMNTSISFYQDVIKLEDHEIISNFGPQFYNLASI